MGVESIEENLETNIFSRSVLLSSDLELVQHSFELTRYCLDLVFPCANPLCVSLRMALASCQI